MTIIADTLVTNVDLLTLCGQGVGYMQDGAVAIRGTEIVGVDSTKALIAGVKAQNTIDGIGKILMPGLIDAHMHTPWAVIRGVAQDIDNWMQKGLAPYASHLTKESRLAGTNLALAEAMRAGTTTFGDYAWPESGWADSFVKAGVRARLTSTINSFPEEDMSSWEVGAVYPLSDKQGKQAIQEAIVFAEQWHGSEQGRISVMLGPQGPDMISCEQLLEVKNVAQKMGLMIHMHTDQGDRETNQMMKRYGKRTPKYLQEIGYLDDQLLAVHLTESSEKEAEMIARSGASMALCSGSIGIIDGIVPPAHAFRQAGGNVALGSDQAAGNNCHNIFNEMKLTALFNKIRYRDPKVLPAWDALRMATIEGARAIGLGEDIGSIEIGKQADLILIDANSPTLTPILDSPIRTIVPNLVYGANGSEVSDSMIAGKWVMRNRKLLTVDQQQIIETAQREAECVAERMCGFSDHADLKLTGAMKQGFL